MYHFKLPEIFQIYIPVNKCLTGEGGKGMETCAQLLRKVIS